MKRGYLIAGVIGALIAAVVALALILILDTGGRGLTTATTGTATAGVSATPSTPPKKYVDDFEPGAGKDLADARLKIGLYCHPPGAQRPTQTEFFVAVDRLTTIATTYPDAIQKSVTSLEPDKKVSTILAEVTQDYKTDCTDSSAYGQKLERTLQEIGGG